MEQPNTTKSRSTNNTHFKFSELKSKWDTFIAVILQPVNIVLLVLTIIFYVASITQTDKSIYAVITLLLSLITGLLGGMWAKDFEKVSEEGIIVVRGKTAIRSLKLLLGSISALDKRAQIYLNRGEEFYKKEASPETLKEVVKTYLEDIILRCSILEEEVISSIENWKDVIPDEADIKTEIGFLTELKTNLEKLTTERNLYKQELEDKDNTEQEKDLLEKEIKSLEKKLIDLNLQYKNQRLQLEGKLYPTPSGIYPASTTNHSGSAYGRRTSIPPMSEINILNLDNIETRNLNEGKKMIHILLQQGVEPEDIVTKLIALGYDENWALKKTQDILVSDPNHKKQRELGPESKKQ